MITKEQFDSLFDDNITKKEYNRILGLIDERFAEICEKFLKKKNQNYPCSKKSIFLIQLFKNNLLNFSRLFSKLIMIIFYSMSTAKRNCNF